MINSVYVNVRMCLSFSKETFLKDAARECKKYIESDPDNINFTVLALTGGQVL